VSAYRLRAEGELLVLQVYVEPEYDSYSYPNERKGTWRDAKLTDIPVYDLFQAPVSQAEPVMYPREFQG
jgi:hypothetical protein